MKYKAPVKDYQYTKQKQKDINGLVKKQNEQGKRNHRKPNGKRTITIGTKKDWSS